MALLFSAVTLSAGDDSIKLLVSGTPKSYEDIDGWKAVDYFLLGIGKEATVQADVKTYLYGEGEVFRASVEEVAYMMKRTEMRSDFLESRCQCVGNSSFSFGWQPEEVFGMRESWLTEQHL